MKSILRFTLIWFWGFLALQVCAQDNFTGVYISDGNKYVVSGPLDTLRIKALSTGEVFEMAKVEPRHYASTQRFNGTLRRLKANFQLDPASKEVELCLQDPKKIIAKKAPLFEEFSTFQSGATKLHGKLVLPQGEGPFPIVVIAQGSGRNSAIIDYPEPYIFASEGIATFVYDKRGTGKSEGEYTQRFDVLSDDLISAFTSIQDHPRLNMEKLGLVGFSQGGWVAPLAASKSPKVKYVAVSFGLAMSIAEEDFYETPLKMKSKGFSNSDIDEIKDLNTAIHAVARTGFKEGWDQVEKKINEYKDKPWFEALKSTQTWAGSLLNMSMEQAKAIAPMLMQSFQPFYDPIATLQKLNIPMFWLFGDEDIEAPVDVSINRINQLIDDHRKPYEMKIYEGADHGMYLFKQNPNGRTYLGHPKDYFPDLTQWLVKQGELQLGDLEYDLVIRGVNVLSMSSEAILENQTIIIDSERIVNLGPTGTEAIKASKTIDATGKYIIPGLHDMHTHLETTAFAQAIGLGEQFPTLPYEDLLAPYLANGITTIQVMAGGEDLIELRDKIEQNEIPGPRIILASPMLDGNPPILPEPFTKVLASPAEVESALTEIQQKGYDFLKLRVGLPRPVFDKIMQTAKKLEMPVWGHVPRGLGLSFEYVVSQGNFGIAHMEEFGYDNSDPDKEAIEGYIQLLKQHNTPITTTLSVFDNIVDKMTDYEATLSRPEVQYVHPLFAGLWRNNPFRQEQTAERLQQIRNQLSSQQKLVKAFYESGITIMLGTDALNPTILPGFSIHRELALLVESGLTPYDALRMATVIPATHLNPGNPDAGTISEGQSANLVIVDGNPFDDLQVLRSPSHVILKGNVFSQAQLEERLVKLSQLLKK